MSWPKRMNAAIEYIEENINDAISTEDVAKSACCSKFHFHRIFYSSFKVSCAEYIRRRKLTLAAVEIQSSDIKIIDIALKYGYESPNAFTRAFRNIHGVNPNQARKKSVKLNSYNRVFFPTEYNTNETMNYKIIEIPQFEIIGKSKEFEFEKFIKEGPKFWKNYVDSEDYQQLLNVSEGKSGKVTGAPLISAYFPKESGSRDEFLDVLSIEKDFQVCTNDFDTFNVAQAKYAEFNCTYRTSIKTNRYIYGEWFSATGYERDNDKPDIVSYFPIPFRPMSEMRVRWWIPILSEK